MQHAREPPTGWLARGRTSEVTRRARARREREAGALATEKKSNLARGFALYGFKVGHT